MSRRAYDHRIKDQILRAGDPHLFPELEIPRSTAVSWIRRDVGEVISLDQGDEGERALRNRAARLERRIAMLMAVLRLVLALLRVSGFRLELSRVADAAGKRRLLGAIERAGDACRCRRRSEFSRLSSARYDAWVRGDRWVDCIPLGLINTQYIDLRGDLADQNFHLLEDALLQKIRELTPDHYLVEPLRRFRLAQGVRCVTSTHPPRGYVSIELPQSSASGGDDDGRAAFFCLAKVSTVSALLDSL
jgi:hypothetical protein